MRECDTYPLQIQREGCANGNSINDPQLVIAMMRGLHVRARRVEMRVCVFAVQVRLLLFLMRDTVWCVKLGPRETDNIVAAAAFKKTKVS